MGIIPEVFEVLDDDLLYVLDETPPDGARDKVEQAVARCPKQAISIVELSSPCGASPSSVRRWPGGTPPRRSAGKGSTAR
ncbi:MAG: ferredoxin [Acidimicrobiales bacterium]